MTYAKWELPHQRKEQGHLKKFSQTQTVRNTQLLPMLLSMINTKWLSQCRTSFLVAIPWRSYELFSIFEQSKSQLMKSPCQRNINSLANSKINKTLSLNNSMAQECISTTEATQQTVQILDAKYKKADLQAVIDPTGLHLSLCDRASYCSYLWSLRNCSMGH